MGASFFTSFFLIFSGAAILATLALYTRQPLIVAYIAIGVILGPSATSLISDPTLIRSVAEIGIIFLLFLLGLDMQPSKLNNMLKDALFVGVCSCLLFFGLGLGVGLLFGFSFLEAAIMGAALMFSSTIIGIKLLPTTVLHHRRTGELVISLLLIQDVVAIIILLMLTGQEATNLATKVVSVLVALPVLGFGAFVFVKYALLKLLEKFDAFHEYIFLIAIGWCLGLAELAKLMGLSHEIGAFIAGVSVATSPIALYIAGHLKPLRDFFLILFFFSIGAEFNLALLGSVILPAMFLAAVVLVGKPIIFRVLLGRISESGDQGWEIGFRLGQISEFSLLIAFMASSQLLISEDASHVIQATAIITFLVSSYLVVFRFPTPIAVSDKLRRD
ncbi:MAG: cation:proton antiporter [Pseudomonadales bacterium]